MEVPVHATVRNYRGSSDLIDLLVENEDAVRSLISGIDGFRAYYLVRTDDGGLSISVFDDEAGAEESNRVAADWVRENASDVRPDPPEVSAGEVVIAL
jgi:hypothetical protein